MKRLLAILAILSCLMAGAFAQGPGDLNSGSQVSLNTSTGAYTLSWWGVGGYTYLIETSDDLINWSYLPVVESGADSIIQWGLTSNASANFMKIEYITVPASQLSGAVFNGPIDPATGLPGDWELFFFGSEGIDLNVDPNGEEFTVLQDYQNGNNPIANQVVNVGPCVGEYLFHETSGTIAHDISSLHNNGTLSGGAGWTVGGYDGQGAVTFDGTSGEVLISNSANQVLPAAGAPFSFGLWFNPNAASVSGTTTLITDEIAGVSGFEFGIDTTTSPPSLLFSTTGSGGIQFETPLQSGTWTQAAVTYDGTTATIYVNGFGVASGTGALVSNTNTLTLGNGLTGTNPFAGAMEDLTFYQAALQPWDVNFLYDLSTTTTGPDPSGIANWWKYKYLGTLNVDPNAFAAWSGSQVTISQAYQNGWNPIDYYNGQAIAPLYIAGSGQTGAPGAFVPAPLIVTVTNSSGPLVGAPVSFTVTTSGSLWKTNLQSLPNPITLQTDANGQIKVFFQLPNTPSTTCSIIAAAVTAPGQPRVTGTFTEQTDNGDTGTTYASPFDPSNVVATLNPDGSADVTWTNNTDPADTEPINVRYKDINGNWKTAITVSAGTTSCHIPPQ